MGELCGRCHVRTVIPHSSTFCKRDGMTRPGEHWCCPGLCELDDAARERDAARRDEADGEHRRFMAEAAVEGDERTIARGATRFWLYEGAVLPASDKPGLSRVATADLLEFAQWCHRHAPDGEVLLHAYGLRLVRLCGQNDGPNLDWRDWD